MIPAMIVRPSAMDDPRRACALPVNIEGDAAEYHREQHERNRAQEKLVTVNGDRFQERVFRDLAEDDADDERRARPFVPLQEITKPAQENDQDKIFPSVMAEVATDDGEEQHNRNHQARLD